MTAPDWTRVFHFRGADVRTWSAIDGDTIRVVADAGDGDRKHRILRLDGIDTPEKHSKNQLERDAAEHVRALVQGWVDDLDPERTFVYSNRKPEKFGRWLGDISCNGVFLVHMMIVSGLARPYHGEAKKPWSDDDLRRILSIRAAVTSPTEPPQAGASLTSSAPASLPPLSDGCEWCGGRRAPGSTKLCEACTRGSEIHSDMHGPNGSSRLPKRTPDFTFAKPEPEDMD